jgi:hypothetical protein
MSMTRVELALLILCTTVGAVVGVSTDGRAALGSAIGAAIGLVAGQLYTSHPRFR